MLSASLLDLNSFKVPFLHISNLQLEGLDNTVAQKAQHKYKFHNTNTSFHNTNTNSTTQIQVVTTKIQISQHKY